MAKHDLRDEYGQKIGEIQEKPFSGGNSYDVRDRYGQKIGEVRQDNSSEVAGNILFAAVVAAFWLIVGAFWLAWKLLVLFSQGLYQISRGLGRLIAAYFRALQTRPVIVVAITAVVFLMAVGGMFAMRSYNAEQKRIDEATQVAFSATYAAEAPVRDARATMTTVAGAAIAARPTVAAQQKIASATAVQVAAQAQQCADTPKFITPTAITSAPNGTIPAPNPGPSVQLEANDYLNGDAIGFLTKISSAESSQRRVDLIISLDALLTCPGGDPQWLTFHGTTYAYIYSGHPEETHGVLTAINKPPWFKNLSVNKILQFRNFQYALYKYDGDVVSPRVFHDVPLPALGGTQAPLASGVPMVSVANTDSDGVYIRRTPQANDKIVAWQDGTKLEIIGADVQGEGRTWKHVRDPKGNEGYVPAEFTAPSGP